MPMRRTIDKSKPDDFPPNIQAIFKRAAPCSAWLNQELLEIDVEDGWVRIGYDLGEPHFNRFGALHGGAIACVMDDVLAVAAGFVAQWGEIAPTLEMKVVLSRTRAAPAVTSPKRRSSSAAADQFPRSDADARDGKVIATSTATIMIAPMKKK